MKELMKETVTIEPVRNITAIKYTFENNEHETELTFTDSSKKYILIEAGMIFVSDWPKAELSKRINEDDCLLYEAYDLTDGCAYYLCSEYAAEIADSVVNLVNRLLGI